MKYINTYMYMCMYCSSTKKAMEWNLSPDMTLSAHDAGGVQLKLSFHQKWIASAANDGKLGVRLVESPVSSRIQYKTVYLWLFVQVGQLV